ncbi:phosphoglucosamine mutase [Peptoniphilus lacrimalis DNF00528]|uniref:Phosphoglucosamine mutase n=1 Tax=Peptoniphilus lacrimalis 315-B TaxID=596330 RepID=D1VT35_9FIRM|nr:phosphoglucosamine mutase [Peptoniphilus lacrimalis]EFA90299.1 phosphoglucosamine mutase [Peptoniphilus lacrimalis 315-B]KGF33455.1 phosphoglucosamine mutase [Peptoniphilus lacrimalis DNF00528]
MGKLFGTDGVRGIANKFLSPDLCFELGRSAGFVLSKEKKGKVIVGRDTRYSGDLIESSLVAGLLSIGFDVDIAGVIPTPGIAYLTKTYDYLLGVEISASHNPYEYNGIKFFSSQGFKLPDEVENEIESIILDDIKLYKDLTGDKIGRINRSDKFVSIYKNYLKNLVKMDLKGKKIALDIGNGALYDIAKEVLESYGAEVIVINDKPNGKNINDNCGSTNPNLIKELVIKEKALMGMSFDGDADRIIAVDEKGSIVDGDHILAICASYLKEKNKLKNNACVGTIMSNMGLEKYLKSIGVNFVATKVGDRYIIEEMRKSDYIVGAEQSGHVIFLEHNTTGDGLATGINLLNIMEDTGKKLSTLNELMTSYPQVLENAKVPDELKRKVLEVPEIKEKIDKIEEKYKGNGRIVIRPSGTEPLVRVMIEGEDIVSIGKDAIELKNFIEEKLN